MADVNIQLPSLTAAATVGDSDLLHVRQGSTDKKLLFSLLKSLVLSDMDGNEILSRLLPVDGAGSLLDSDLLDGQEGSYYRDASNLNTGTIQQERLDAATLLTLLLTVDGAASGLDSDLLDGQEGSYYRNASNLNAGIVPSSRIVNVKDKNGTDRSAGYTPAFFTTSGSVTLSDQYLGHILEFVGGTGSVTLYPPSSGKEGSLVQVVNATGNSHAISTGGLTLRWLQGGTLYTGSVTMLPYSACTLMYAGGNVWRVWGNGLST